MRTGVPQNLLESIQQAALTYTYKGIPTIKDCFALALYPLILWEHKPQTIIEIGTNRGGSALWLSDVMHAYNLSCHVYSIDINPTSSVLNQEKLTYLIGDGQSLAKILSADMMANLVHPLVVIDDASHLPETTSAILQFFDRWMQSGDYFIIEDGNVVDLYPDQYLGGPLVAIEEFLASHGDYEIDRRYCNFFGPNVTWNLDGYLRRK